MGGGRKRGKERQEDGGSVDSRNKDTKLFVTLTIPLPTLHTHLSCLIQQFSVKAALLHHAFHVSCFAHSAPRVGAEQPRGLGRRATR